MCSINHLMRQMLITLWIGFVIFESIKASSSDELPCDFYDSINITEGVHHPNESITFNGTEYNDNNYARINYDVVNGTRMEVRPYFRGCPCKIKPCVRLCCPYGMFAKFDLSTISCDDENETAKKFEIKMSDENNQEFTVSSVQLSYVNDLCKSERYFGDNVTIYETGQVLEMSESVSHRNYCLAIFEHNNQVLYEVMICSVGVYEEEFRHRVLPWVMITSVILIIITFIVYVSIPELLNLNVTCFLCYLASLATAFILFAWIELSGYLEPPICKTFASLIYFSLMSTTAWSNVISFNVWICFRKTFRIRKFTQRTQFMMFMAYGWGLPLILLATIHLADASSIPDYLKPGVGTETCFLKESTKISKVLSWHLPTCILFSVNIAFFILTALKIFRAKRDIGATMAESRVNTNRENYFIYARLFVMMGIIWFLEAISFATGDTVSFIIAILNTSQGVVIFTLFVMRRRVFDLIKDRYYALLGKMQSANVSAATSVSTDLPSNSANTSNNASKL